MSTLENSERRLLQAVHTRVTPRPRYEREPQDFLGRIGYATALRLREQGLRDLRGRMTARSSKQGVPDPRHEAALDALEQVARRKGEPDPLAVADALRDVDPEALLEVGEELGRLREEQARELDERWPALLHKITRSRAPEETEGPEEPSLQDFEDLEPGATGVAGRLLRRVTRGPEVRVRPSDDDAPRPDVGRSRTGRRAGTVDTPPEREEYVWIPPASPGLRRVSAPEPTTLEDVFRWKSAEGEDAELIERVRDAVGRAGLAPYTVRSSDARWVFAEEVAHVANLTHTFKKSLQSPNVTPVGLLHLERLTFVPAGIERGELVYSVPMAPDEQVSISHKEWSNTTEEFERIVNDFIEEYSEEGVTEKSEIAQATSSERDHKQGFNVGVTATGGYGPVSITSTFGASVSDSASSSEQFSRDQSISVTRKASSRVKKEHKTSFKIVTTSGTEDQTVRTFKNPHADKATRVDYYQLIRKWEVKVYRYGLRLTYDLNVPEPGSDVLGRILEIQAIREALQLGFGSGASQPWARFDLDPGQITRTNYASLAAEYNAAVPEPPVQDIWYDEARIHKWNSQEEADKNEFHELSIEVDKDYVIKSAVVDKNSTHWEDETHWLGLQNIDDFMGKSGKRVLVYRAKNLASAYVELRVRAQLGSEALASWQMKAWTAMRDGAQARYYEKRQTLQERLNELEGQLGGDDALSLRKFEREEIMKGVLRWLFGPDFYFVPPGTPTDLYNSVEAVKSPYLWNRTLAHGKLIQFLHHAIEWENVLYFLYPYFWSHLSRWEMKKYLDHPDPTHRAFLKSGSARVVLTIRPGFERDFLALVETGSFSSLPDNHPYVTIVEEMENYAQTNYPGIPPANPELADENEKGVLIGTWNEYTPTSALDIAFGETLPTA